MNPSLPRPLLILLLACLFPVAARADEHAELFARLDANADSFVTAKEVPADQAALFRRLVRNADDDADGKLSLQEFQKGLTSSRPDKPLTEKLNSDIPGSDALLLVLALMDSNADLMIRAGEVPKNLKPLYDQFLKVLNQPEGSPIQVPRLRQESFRYAIGSDRFLRRLGYDVDVELSLLNDKQWEYVEQLRTSLRPGRMIGNPKTASMMFGQLDTNGDGKIALDEVPEPMSGRFEILLERADRDQDKQLSEEEFRRVSKMIAAFESDDPPSEQSEQLVKRLMKRADRDADGRLSREETPPRLAKRFEDLDRNGDGFIENDELARAAEILAKLRNSAEIRPASSPSSSSSIKKPGKN